MTKTIAHPRSGPRVDDRTANPGLERIAVLNIATDAERGPFHPTDEREA